MNLPAPTKKISSTYLMTMSDSTKERIRMIEKTARMIWLVLGLFVFLLGVLPFAIRKTFLFNS